MGIRYPQITGLLEKAVRDEVSQSFAGLTMIELGEQNMTGDTHISLAKDYFLAKGFLHTSFDIKSTGSAVEVDLSKPVNSNVKADVVTNFGTTEHICQGDNPQYYAYRNVHNFTKKGGLMFHFVPKSGSWPNHCDYWYKLNFFEALFNLLDYRAVKVEYASDSIPFYKAPKDMCIAVAVKQSDNDFLTQEAFSPLYKMLEIKANRS